MTEATNDTNQPSSTEPTVETKLAEDVSNRTEQVAAAVVGIDTLAHKEAQSVFESLVAKLSNFEHALAADARADLEKLKALLHL